MKQKRKLKKHSYISYIDAVCSLDADLRMVAALCQAATDDVIDGAEVLHWVGEMIERHVNQNRILRKKYFDEPLGFSAEVFLENERERLNVKVPTSIKKKKRGKK